MTWSERLRRFFRPPRTLKITPVGRWYLIITIGVGIGALNTGNNLLYLVLGLQLSTIILSGILSENTLRGVQVRRLGTEAAFAGEPFVFRWSLTRSKGTSFALSVSEDDVPLTGGGHAAIIEAGQEHIVRAPLTAPRRGPIHLKGVRITTTFPLGLFAKTRTIDSKDTLLVYPKRLPPERRLPESTGGPMGQQGNPRHLDGEGEVISLRELAPSEDARRVHWMKSAAAGKLLRVEREREERKSYMLTLAQTLPPDALDDECERVAGLAQTLFTAGHEVGLHTPTRRLRPASGAKQHQRLLQALAWAGFEEHA